MVPLVDEQKTTALKASKRSAQIPDCQFFGENYFLPYTDRGSDLGEEIF